MAARAAPAQGGARWAALWPLALGLALLGLLWAGPLPVWARLAFTGHMVLHLGVMVLAAPLLALGLARWVGPRAGGGWLPLAIAASVAELAVVWAWHAPAAHQAAALRPGLFWLQQASFLAVGLAVWLPGFAGAGRAAAGAAVLAMAMSLMHMSMLGALLTTAPRLIYSPDLCGGAFGLGPLDDQRLGGVLMAVGGGLPYLLGGLAFAWRLLDTGGAEGTGGPPAA